mgnify:CR=1 FL=1
MANRRMFSLSVIDTDKFLDMPVSSQLLYFHLGMRADDDGFVSSPKRIARTTNCGDDDLRILATKGYIIPFESGVVVIRHWRQNNQLRSDRYRETVCKNEKATLSIIDNIYIESTNEAPDSIPVGIPNDIPNSVPTGKPTVDSTTYQREPQYSIGKYSIDKYSIDKDSIDKSSIDKSSIEKVEDRESIDNRGYGGKKERERKEPNETSYPQCSSSSYPQSQQLEPNDIVGLFNGICTTYPTVNDITQYSTALSNSLILDRYSKADYSTIFQKAEQSSTLKARIHSEETPVDFGWILEHSKEIKDGAFDN